MDQDVINGLQHLQLTKEEEEEISISTSGSSNLLEECKLSLFGRLLADRHQNIRALKSTLRLVWKMGLDFRIVDVGKNIFQFKFSSSYQLEWVERNGPWNFDNNLLLLCRWRKSLSTENISFTHTPLWVQVWSLPFESMTEEVGKDLGSKLGKFIDSDRRSWLSEQAKFMRIRVDIPIDKPLRRGANVVNSNGDKFWVTFKYERLPNFCFLCGILGHDEKHCSDFQGKAEGHRQYGDWLHASNGFKGGFEKQKATSSGGHENRTERMEEDSSIPVFPRNTNLVSLETEQAGLSSGQSNHTSSHCTDQGHGNMVNAMSANNQRSDNTVSSLCPALSL